MVLTQQIVYKQIEDLKEMQDVVYFQEEIWGNAVVTPLPQLIAASHHGGIIIGAFNEGELIGFTYGFSGYKNEEHYLISHMTGVRQNYQNYGIGLNLKLKQRELAIEYGYKNIKWTFDPLEARNAYFNLNKLGAYAKTYFNSYYGEMGDKLNTGLPSDRFLVEWDICSNRVTEALFGPQKGSSFKNYHPLLTWSDFGDIPLPLDEKPIENEIGYLVPVPANFQSLKQVDNGAAKAWRYKFRNVVSKAISKGYKVTGIIKNTTNVHFYIIENNVEALHD
ncbi:GNAT family N-acetyltransferase (plasmid) [Bacillus sp. F19]|nr:GNAT family N-acetyltransferase [Bacillus sp. F19]